MFTHNTLYLEVDLVTYYTACHYTFATYSTPASSCMFVNRLPLLGISEVAALISSIYSIEQTFGCEHSSQI